MREEFHGNGGEGGTWIHKLLYGWGTTNASIWLPSLSELVGIDPDNYTEWNGCYYSAMQGLNASTSYWTDSKGGTQFAYLKQFNASGGGQRIWDACNQQISWLRSTCYGNAITAWRITNAQQFDWTNATASHTVHPAGESTYLKNAEKTREKRKIVTI